MLKLLKLPVILLLILSIYSCGKSETIELKEKAKLEVAVTGTLSGKPRENITVAIYASESEADNQQNAVKVGQKTNAEGKTNFTGLDQNTRFWVRADALLSSKVKQTNSLSGGDNTFDINLL